ncbi:hypothetical protein [Paenibacillus sanguinis]|uniref:hypothetical protein n=1 Tax=Paenibacillus sanguinis TaxID=225906 RepID=UPI00037973D0|nr:hypothetical protein [Paenibacillus sanguinis]
MRSKFGQIAWLTAAGLLLALTAGCSSEQDAFSEKIGDMALNTVDKVQDSLELTVDNWAENMTSKQVTHELSHTTDIGKADKLIIDNQVGSVEVVQGTTDQLSVGAVITVQQGRISQKQQEELFEASTVSVTTKKGITEVRVHAKDDAGQSLWSWANKTLKTSEFTIDYIVQVPASVQEFDIGVAVGNIKVAGVTGKYRLEGDVGSISVQDGGIVGKSTIATETGSVNLSLASLEPDSTLHVNADVGSITASVADSIGYTLETATELGQITGAPEGTSEQNGGGPRVSLTTSLGSIKVE